MNLIIDGVEVTFLSSTELNQSYAPVAEGIILRMADGSGVKQSPTWGKLKTQITASGWIPEGLSNVDFSAAVVVDCVGQRSITSTSNIIAISDTVRPDLDPWGIAFVNGLWEKVGSTWAAGTLTIDVTTGATLYQARWMPRLTLLCNDPETNTDQSGAVYGWSLYGEEQ